MSDEVKAAFERTRKAIDALLKMAADKDYNSQDAKFVQEMIKHHEMAVEMSEKQGSKGKNEEIVKLAKAIGEAQKGEIAQMRKWLKDRKLSADGGGM